MTATTASPEQQEQGWRSGPRAAIQARTLRKDRWWAEPTITGVVLVSFIAALLIGGADVLINFFVAAGARL